MEPAHNLLFNQVKAGLGYIDPDQISHKITEVSKDTKYYQKQKERSKIIDQQIDDLKLKLRFANKTELNLAKIQVDSYIKSLEKKRDLEQVIFHADLDAFFASVEVINDPSLEGIPFAVGGSIKHGVISTSSYEARKFGVRSGMAVFIALSLCPQLRIVKPSGRYGEFSKKVQSEFEYYDPNYISFGLDEASMNVTEYLKKTAKTAVEVAKEIQEKVYNKTKLTISIGIAHTNQLAKIASDINKPNGVFEVPRDIDGLLSFISSLPVRKIPGIGGVTERKLQELNFTKMGDILDRRDEVWFLFSQSFCKFIFSSALGIQCNSINKDERKSISTEETFEATNDLDILLEKVERMAEKLALNLQKNSMRCKTVTVKFKTHDFQQITQQLTLNQESSKICDISGAAVKILMEEHHTKHYKLRLIGVRVSNLVYRGEKIQISIKDMISTLEKNTDLSLTHREHSIWEQDVSDIDFEEKNDLSDTSISKSFKEGSNQNEINNDFDIQFESENQNQKKNDPFKFSIDNYFQKGNDVPCISENSDQSSNNNEKIEKKDETDFSIKRYFKVGKNEIDYNNHNNNSNCKDKSKYQKNQEKKKKDDLIFSIRKYLYKEYNEDEKNNYPNSEPGNNHQEPKLDVEDKEISIFSNNNTYQASNILNEIDQSQSESENMFDKSSDYDDNLIENELFVQPVNNCATKINKNAKTSKLQRKQSAMKKIIESYFPESSWESEKKRINQLPKILLNSPKRRQKTKAGTFAIGSFFNKSPSVLE